jgi:hypothetical protein
MSPLTESTRLTLAKGQPVPNDPSFAFNSLLLHGNGTNGSTVITDSSGSPKVVTAVGNAQISTTQSKFGGASIAFDGTGDYLTISSQLLNSSIWTIEAWFYPTNLSSNNILFAQYGPGTLADRTVFGVQSNGSAWIFNGNQGSNTSSAGLVTINSWHHIVFVRTSATTVTAFVNGAQAVQKTNFNGPPATNTWLGGYEGFDQLTFGYLDEVRVTSGIARYTSNFTPPTLPFPDF